MIPSCRRSEQLHIGGGAGQPLACGVCLYQVCAPWCYMMLTDIMGQYFRGKCLNSYLKFLFGKSFYYILFLRSDQAKLLVKEGSPHVPYKSAKMKMVEYKHVLYTPV